MKENPASQDPLRLFDPVMAGWFRDQFSSPTHIQEIAWPRIVAGEHVLLSAPTGSGKTFTAFLWPMNQLASGAWPVGETSVLYISPLKALNNDIRTNLSEPLSDIRKHYSVENRTFPEISVRTRSGDTPQSERQRMVRHPPEILITTPESLNIILSSSRARQMLATVRMVIMDEIHAVVGSKRGTHLITAVDRLTLLAGEFQRIGISATVKPMDLVAEFIGGYRRVGDGYEPRKVVPLSAPRDKRIALAVRFPVSVEEPGDRADGPEKHAVIWPSLVKELHSIIQRNRSTLIFVTTRRHAEKLTELLNEDLDEPMAYAHHGSLSREIRGYVEESLKAGRLRAIVATNSLELGIDIGQLDEVVMVKSPMTVSSTLQRVGRAGHQVGATSRGILFPLYGRDAVDAAVLARATLEQDIESASPVVAPLDVLAQQLVSMTVVETWDIDELYAEIRCSWPYRSLGRRTFDLVVEMLAGRYAESRIRELRPRVVIDRVDNTIRAREGVLAVLFQSGGTIPDRGYYGLRIAGDGSKVGELDEEFVWERRIGDTFYLGSQLWTVTTITDRDVEVVPGSPGAHIIPFWKAEARGRGRHYSELTGEFLERCEEAIQRDRLEALLVEREELAPSVRAVVAQTLTSQRAATGTPLPHRHHLVVEHYLRVRNHGRHGHHAAATGPDGKEIIVHCPWGTGVNQPFSLVLAGVWEEEYGYPLEVFADDACMVLLLPAEFTVADAFGPAICRGLLRPGRVEHLLRARLEQSGFFGALFRENAGRALLLPKGGFNRRMPLWLNRLRSRKLLSAVQSFEDFPILLETWRTCLEDHFDLPGLRALLSDIASGAVSISECETTNPSPFAADVVWRQTDLSMYSDDSRPGGSGSRLSDDLLRDAARNAALRPDIPEELATQLEQRLQRLSPGYAPTSPTELLEWLKERIAMPAGEALRLRDAIERDIGDSSPPTPPLDRLCWLILDRADEPLLVAVEQLSAVGSLLPHLCADDLRDLDPDAWWKPPADGGAQTGGGGPTPPLAAPALRFLRPAADLTAADPVPILAQWLRFYGPREARWPARALGMDHDFYDDVMVDLGRSDTVIAGSFIRGREELQVCDAENLERLLAMLRRSHRPVFEPVPAQSLVGLWAETSGFMTTGLITSDSDRGDPDKLVHVLETLFGYPAPVHLWESDFIPSRLRGYSPVWLDGLFKESGLTWFGSGSERIGFGLSDDLPLFLPAGPANAEEPANAEDEHTANLMDLLHERRDAEFWELAERLQVSSEELTRLLWTAAWNGRIANDSYETVRKGALSRFTATPVSAGGGAPVSSWPGQRRSSRSRGRWTASRPLSGRWFALGPADSETDSVDPTLDPIADLEMNKERARIVLERYGIVFRELLGRELPALRWSRLFRALRMMELSGEVVAGGFVKGVPGVQFALPRALPALAEGSGSEQVIWMNAADPASPCGLIIGKCYPGLPPRVPSNHVVFRSNDLVMVSRRNGADLTFHVDPTDPDLHQMVAPLRNMVGRRWNPRARVTVEVINETTASESPYVDALVRGDFRRDRRRLVLSARYQ